MAAYPPRRFAVVRRRAPATSRRLCGQPARPAHHSLPVPFSGRSWPLPVLGTDPRGAGMRFFSDNAAAVCPEVMAALVEANSLDTAYDGDRWSGQLNNRFSELFGTEVSA